MPGRPRKKPEYDPNTVLQTLQSAVVEAYLNPESPADEDANGHTFLKVLSDQFHLSNLKIRKLLVTADVYQARNRKLDPTTGKYITVDYVEEVQCLAAAGRSIQQIMAELSMSRATVYSYLPYTIGVYQTGDDVNKDEISQNAERHRAYRCRKAAVKALSDTPTEENLWNAVVAFQGYQFYTVSGQPFTYTLKEGRHGLTKELWVDRRENSKSLAWSSVLLAYQNALALQETEVPRPKALGDIRGVSYIYPLLWRFGIILAPKQNAEKMEYRRKSELTRED